MFKVLHGVANIVCALAAIMLEAVLAIDIAYMVKNPTAWSTTTVVAEIILFAFCVLISAILVADLIRRDDKL